MPLREFKHSGKEFVVTQKMKDDFNDAGYILVRGLIDTEELNNVKDALEGDSAILQHSFTVSDGEDRNSRYCVWNQPGNDVTGMVARCEKVAGTCEELMNGEIYHYHTKLMMKEAKTGGKFVWHQDYGYWYKNGCLFPDMLTVFIPIDRSIKENGCIQILEGSHKCGRIEHLLVGDQVGADLERVKELQKVCEHLYVEMEPGDALFFHSNLLHTSNVNLSEMRRWAFLIAYNKASNNPVYKHHLPCYTPLMKVPNSAIKECTNTDMQGKDFMDPNADTRIRQVK